MPTSNFKIYQSVFWAGSSIYFFGFCCNTHVGHKVCMHKDEEKKKEKSRRFKRTIFFSSKNMKKKKMEEEE
jgi:hypothetical protein